MVSTCRVTEVSLRAQAWTRIVRSDVIRCDTDNVLLTVVDGGIEGEGGFTWQHVNLLLLRVEGPR